MKKSDKKICKWYLIDFNYALDINIERVDLLDIIKKLCYSL